MKNAKISYYHKMSLYFFSLFVFPSFLYYYTYVFSHNTKFLKATYCGFFYLLYNIKSNSIKKSIKFKF